MLFHRRAESFSATFRPNTFNPETRTVEVVWSTGATVRRSFLDGTPFDESLSMDARHVRMDRLTSGAAPFLDSHRRESTSDTLGVVERAWLDAATGHGHALVRFSEREEVKPILRDVASGVLRNISVGYRIYRIEEVARQAGGGVPLYRAVDWEPFEISLVPVPADVGATTRSQGESYVCEVVRSFAGSSLPHQGPGPQHGHGGQGNGAPGAGGGMDLGPERHRASEILTLAEKHGMGSEWAARHIALGTSISSCREAVLQALEQRTMGLGIGRPATVTQDAHDTFVRAAELAIFERVRPGTLKDDREKELARRFRGKRMLQIFEAFLAERGVNTDGLLPSEIIERGFHTTTDFPIVLANVAKKTLRAAYAEMPQTWRPLVRFEDLADFKEVSRVQIGEAPKLVEKKEGAPVTYGTFGEAQEKYRLRTFARAISYTREMIINDDLSAFNRIPLMFARSCSDLESDLAWEPFVLNPNMGDGKPLFEKSRGNVGAKAELSVAALASARVAMWTLKGLDGTRLSLVPQYLIVPPSLELAARQILAPITPTTTGNVNPYAGTLTPIIEPRLEETKAWFLACSPSQIDTIEFAYLEGRRGPVVETEKAFENDVVKLKVTLDCASKAIDWRGFFKTPIA